MKRTLVKVRKAERRVKRQIKLKGASFIEYFSKRMDKEAQPLLSID